MTGKRSFFKNILLAINLIIIILYLITCCYPFINTSEYWLLAFPGLIFPVLFFALSSFIFFWLILKSRWWLISLVILLIGFQQIKTAFAFNSPKAFNHQKAANTLRVLQWNVESWGGYDNYRNSMTFTHMTNVLSKQDADVMCFEEYFDYIYPDNYEPVTKSLAALGYPYHFFVASESSVNKYESGIAIFSKFPITDTGSYKLDPGRYSEHLIYGDIKVGDSTFRIYATHLQSVHFHPKEYRSLSDLKHGHGAGLDDSRTIVSKLKRGYISRYKQAEMVNEKLRESPYRSFICGDFNDVPNSSTYFKIKGNFQDAFLQKGTFIGRTFRYISPTLRIDYILTDKRFTVSQYQRIKVTYSDHYPVEADLSY